MVKRLVMSVLSCALLTSVCAGLLRAETYSVPSGTTVHCRLAQTLTTGLSLQGDPFAANITEPVTVGGHEVIPVGAKIEGRIVRMEKPGRVRGVGELRLLPEKITFLDGKSYPMSALLMSAYGAEGAKVAGEEGTVKGPSSRLKTFEEIGGGAGAGGLFGLLIHHPIVGLAVGGAAGFVDRFRRGGQDLVLPSGTQLNYQLTRTLELSR